MSQMKKLKLIVVTATVSLAALVGVAAAKGHHGGRAAMMQKFDANGDGKLDDAERAQAKAARVQQRAARIAQFDANKNGTLDPAEKQAMFETRAAARFAKLDANKDGKLTLDEFKAGKQMHRGKHKP